MSVEYDDGHFTYDDIRVLFDGLPAPTGTPERTRPWPSASYLNAWLLLFGVWF